MNSKYFLLPIILLTPLSICAQLSPIVPNDPLFSQQWDMRKIGMTNAWAATTGSTNIVVAIIDTGVDYTHPDLAPNMWRNPGETGLDTNGNDKATNGIDDDVNGYVDDVHGIDVVNGTGDPMDTGFFDPPDPPTYHGTFVAGLIGAVGNNGLGVTGLNWAVKIMAVRAFGGDRSDPQYFTRNWRDMAAAWDYVVTMKRRGVNVRIISNSYGVRFDIAAMRDAVAQAAEEGILSVFAAGNFPVNQDLFSYFPGAFNLPSAINVAASTQFDSLWASSAFGRSTVDLAAPGENLLSTRKGSNYQSGFSGSSGSAPLVSGAAALLLSVKPDLTADQLKAALFGSVDQSFSFKDKVVTGGRLNVARALEYLTNPNPPAIVINASPAGQRTATNAPIQVTLNRAMNRASVEASFVLGPPLSGRFEWAADNRSFSFRPDVPFDATTNYTARILGTALDDVGGTLDGDFDRTREGSPADDFVWTFRFPIPNDDFANAPWLSGSVGLVPGSNRYANGEVGEPAHVSGDYRQFGSSIWYRWTAPQPGGWFTFDLTSGTSFDSLLAIYVGDQLDRLVVVGGNDNYGSRISSRVSFAAIAGTNYALVVAGKNAYDPNQAGNFTLVWYPTPPPVISNFSPLTAYLARR